MSNNNKFITILALLVSYNIAAQPNNEDITKWAKIRSEFDIEHALIYVKYSQQSLSNNIDILFKKNKLFEREVHDLVSKYYKDFVELGLNPDLCNWKSSQQIIELAKSAYFREINEILNSGFAKIKTKYDLNDQDTFEFIDFINRLCKLLRA